MIIGIVCGSMILAGVIIKDKDFVKAGVILFIAGLLSIVIGNITIRYDEERDKETPYNVETYKDETTIYKIITDRAGDVIYCEPME